MELMLKELVLSGLSWKICLIYLDDVIVYGGNFYGALDRLKTAWQRIREANLKLKPPSVVSCVIECHSYSTIFCVKGWKLIQ